MTVTARLDRIPWSSYQRRVATVLALCFAFELADINTFAYAAPALRASLGISVREVSVITSAGFFGMFLGAAVGGRVAERFGRRRSLQASVAWFSVFSLLNAGAFDAATLFLARIATGIGLGAMTITAITYLAELAPAAQRGRLQSITLAMGLLGIPAMSFFARGVIGVSPDAWRLVFIFGGLGLLPLLLISRLPESPLWLLARGRSGDAERVVDGIELSGDPILRFRSDAYRESVIPAAVRARVSVEAGIAQSWHDIVGDSGRCVSLEHYGASAAYKTLYDEFGITADAVVQAAKDSIATAAQISGPGVPPGRAAAGPVGPADAGN